MQAFRRANCLLCALGWLAVSCTAPDDGNNVGPTGTGPNGEDCIDLTNDWPPEGPEEGYSILVPTVVVAPGTEVIYCYFGTYDGPDAGVVSFFPEPAEGFLHHSLLKRVDNEEYPDGTVIDCTSEEAQFPPKPTLFESVGGDESDWINLPEGLAFKFKHGQRWVADVHIVNTSPDPICMNTAFYLGLVPEEEVTGYVSTFNLDVGGFGLPPGELSTESFSCAWPSEMSILSIGGHMHDFGSSMFTYWQPPEGDVMAIYDVPDWHPNYRYEPPVSQYNLGEVLVEEGQLVDVECNWYNASTQTLGYPEEMCTIFGVATPLEEGFYCDDGTIL